MRHLPGSSPNGGSSLEDTARFAGRSPIAARTLARSVARAFAPIAFLRAALVPSVSVLILAVPAAPLAEAKVKIDSNTFGAVEARSIGPAVMGGRIMALDAVLSDPRTIYVGAAGGGVWKSIDAGTKFKPVFDKYTQSIGAIAIDPTRPTTVWVGTGEGCTRNSVSSGTGLYKTTDGGENWSFAGLADSERIPRIVVDPKNPETVYVAALGHLWDGNDERGVYRTRDGGKTWDRVLFVDRDTGCADLAMDPTDPLVLYAAMWQFRRRPDFFTSGGPGSGLYKTTDGGKTWRRLTQGLPEGDLGRIALAIAPSRPATIYANVEAKKTAFYRSEDAGETWTRLDTSFNTVARPFYFSHLVADPKNPRRVYKLGFTLSVTDDGGESFTSPFVEGGDIHGDLHALWVSPDDPNFMLLGSDGGVYASRSRGNAWSYLNNLPIAQFYHVSVDMGRPYHVYGGLQDNGSWSGPSRSPNGIQDRDWRNIGLGDGFHAWADPIDRDVVYSEYQGGNVLRRHLSTEEAKEIRPYPKEGEPKYRFNWNTPIELSRSEPGVLYVGAQYVFRSADKGESWDRISPDLTTNDPQKQRQEESGGLTIDNSSAENHCTIYTISSSPKDRNVLWAGTDDGNLQVTRDGGRTWTNVAGSVPGLPPHTWCSGVEAGSHEAGTAFAVFDGHWTGDRETYVYRTADYGKSWSSIATEDVKGWARVIRQDPVNRDLLFLGTESGLFVTVDGGEQWAQMTGKLPSVPVHDLAIHPRDGDLVVATHGRGLYIVDDLSPLRQLTAEVLESEARLLDSRPTPITIPDDLQEFPGDQSYVGRNPTDVATITYYLKKRHVFGDLKVEIYDPKGKLVQTLPGGRRPGLNRIHWYMRMRPPKVPPSPEIAGRALFGPVLDEGTYTVKLLKGDEVYTGKVVLIADPASQHSAADRAAQHELVMKLYRMQEDLAFLDDVVKGARDQARERGAHLSPQKAPGGSPKKGVADDADSARTAAKSAMGRSGSGTARGSGRASKDPLVRSLEAFADRLDALHKTLVATKEGFLTGEEQLRERVVDVYGAVSGFGGRPTRSQVDRAGVLEGEMATKTKEFDAIVRTDLDRLNQALQKKSQAPITLPTREEFDKKEAG